MTTLRAGDMQHDPVEWRGFKLLQWFGNSRTAALQSDSSIINGPRLRLSVKYLKGKPTSYDATISMSNVTCEVYDFGDPSTALDEASERIQRLAKALTSERAG